MLIQKIENHFQYSLILPDSQSTVRLRHDAVGAARVEAGHDTALLVLSEWKLGLIAVAVGLVHAQDRTHRGICETTQAL